MADIDFGISVRRMACETVLCVRGEVDVATAPALRTAITEILRGARECWSSIWSAVTFPRIESTVSRPVRRIG
jgi:hypothetical protein